MTMKKVALFCLYVIVCIILLFFSLHTYRNTCAKTVLVQKKLTIVATTTIIADAINNIVGDKAGVRCLMGPGIDPHVYRARESDVRTLADADIIFYNGLHLEGKMAHVLEKMNRFITTVAVADALSLDKLRMVDEDGLYDPHIWFDVLLWIDVVNYICDTIQTKDPLNSDFYNEQRKIYCAHLYDIHNDVVAASNRIVPDKRILVTAHDAFGYFGRRYGWSVVGLQGLSTDSDISTYDIKALASYIAQKKIKAIFVESSIGQRSLIAVQNAVQSLGWSVSIGDELYSDSLSDNLSNASDYCGMIKHNIDVIVSALAD